ncbi:MAG: hypothetical protein ABSF90_03745 [Syntrophobacteraceae bacterium]|jgi:uncharacterized protein with HEPN domain
MRPDDHIRLLHMIEAIQTVMEFVSGRQAADLETDRMLLFALVRVVNFFVNTSTHAGGQFLHDQNKNDR